VQPDSRSLRTFRDRRSSSRTLYNFDTAIKIPCLYALMSPGGRMATSPSAGAWSVRRGRPTVGAQSPRVHCRHRPVAVAIRSARITARDGSGSWPLKSGFRPFGVRTSHIAREPKAACRRRARTPHSLQPDFALRTRAPPKSPPPTVMLALPRRVPAAPRPQPAAVADRDLCPEPAPCRPLPVARCPKAVACPPGLDSACSFAYRARVPSWGGPARTSSHATREDQP
jgi:hypothetical protein